MFILEVGRVYLCCSRINRRWTMSNYFRTNGSWSRNERQPYNLNVTHDRSTPADQFLIERVKDTRGFDNRREFNRRGIYRAWKPSIGAMRGKYTARLKPPWFARTSAHSMQVRGGKYAPGTRRATNNTDVDTEDRLPDTFTCGVRYQVLL